MFWTFKVILCCCIDTASGTHDSGEVNNIYKWWTYGVAVLCIFFFLIPKSQVQNTWGIINTEQISHKKERDKQLLKPCCLSKHVISRSGSFIYPWGVVLYDKARVEVDGNNTLPFYFQGLQIDINLRNTEIKCNGDKHQIKKRSPTGFRC